MPEEPSIAVLVERIGNVQADVTEIKDSMATRNDQHVTDRQITALTAALASERTERIASIEAERKAREIAIEKEATERKAVAARLQTVEDREESRKWYILAAIIVGAVSLAWNILGGVISTVGGG